MENLADKIEHKFISHAVDLSRFEEEVQQKALIFLKQLDSELAKDIIDNLGTGYTQAKIAALKAQIKVTIATAYANLENTVDKELNGLAAVEQNFVINAVNSSVGANLVTTTLLPDTLKTLTDKNMIFGVPSSDWWRKQTADMQEKFMVQIRMGVSRGETLDQLTQRVRGKATGKRTGYKTASGEQRYLVDFKGGIMDVQTRDAKSLIRTSVQSVANSVMQKTFEANSDVIKGQAWLSTLDMRTTPYCRSVDGFEWDLEGKPLNGHSEPFNPPPAHWNCRSATVPLLKSWADLSNSKSPDLQKKLRKIEKNIPEGTRASMGGPVSEKLNYKQWFDKQPEAVQLEILGPGKLRIYEKGKLSFRQMVDQRGNPLTIEELTAKVGG
jgi:SPP1 gp7 family putative phage head morphogenesis protein